MVCYRENILTILDLFHLVNLGLLSLINIKTLSDHLQLSISSTVYIVSVNMSLVVSVGTVLTHIYVLIVSFDGLGCLFILASRQFQKVSR